MGYHYQSRLGTTDTNYELIFLDVETDNITFYGQLDEPVHRWFRLTAAFSPDLVRRCLTRFTTEGETRTVLDPFCGTGTTVVESLRNGHNALGVEYNPIYERVARAKATSWDIDTDELREVQHTVISDAWELSFQWNEKSITEIEEETDVYFPEIYNRDRWWDEKTLKELVALREAIDNADAPDRQKELLMVGLLAILVDASNATYNHVSLSFMDEPQGYVNAIDLFDDKMVQIRSDIRVLGPARGTVDVIGGDSTKLTESVDPNSADTIITSPPYPNRYSYIRETRPHLFFLDLVEDAGEVGEMALDSVGGTWGRATSELEDAYIEPVNSVVEDALEDVEPLLDEQDRPMRNYVVKYFNKMEKHMQGVEKVLQDGSNMAYTVGNSELKGVEVRTDEILADMFIEHGYDDVTIARARSRNSKKALYEAIVYASDR